MRVFYVPFNNRGLGVDTYEESGFMKDLLQQASNEHIEAGDNGIVFLYVSEPDSGLIKVFSKSSWPKWLIGVNMVVRDSFSIEEGDRMAIDLADGCMEDVVVFSPYPTGMMTEQEVASAYKKLKDKWGWGYVAPIERTEETNVTE